jgi:uncharacterized protein
MSINMATTNKPKSVWFDLENSPHVPFFVPIIEEITKRGHNVVVTGRDCFQVAELVKLYNLDCKVIGRHYGKRRIMKLSGLLYRSLQLAPTVLREKPDLAVSHGSRSQLIASYLLRIPHLLLLDYEFVHGLGPVKPDWVMVPDVIPTNGIKFQSSHVLKYPGIKEDVYIERFAPDASLRAKLGCSEQDILVVMRPPANEAHYHNPQSDELYKASIALLSKHSNAKVVLLPRNGNQAAAARQMWPDLISSGKVFIPDQVIDGRNLIWNSDLVISGGGTMNREAAALGVPVYSIFRGETGAVDKFLAREGRLELIESVDEVPTKIMLRRRNNSSTQDQPQRRALEVIADTIVSLVESPSKSPVRTEEEPKWSVKTAEPL